MVTLEQTTVCIKNEICCSVLWIKLCKRFLPVELRRDMHVHMHMHTHARMQACTHARTHACMHEEKCHEFPLHIMNEFIYEDDHRLWPKRLIK